MIYKYPKIVQGTAFDAKIPCVIQNPDGTREPIDVATLQDVSVRVIGRNCKDMQVEWSGVSNYFIAHIPATFPIDTYKVEVEGVLGGRSVSSVFERGFAIVAANEYADYEDYIAGGEMSMPETIWVLAQDADVIEQVIEEYRQAKAQADAVKAEYERKVQELDGVAQETKATLNKEEVLRAIENIPAPDLSKVAKQGYNADATNTAILNAINSIPQPTDYAKESTSMAIEDKIDQIMAANILHPNLQGITFVDGGATDDVAELAASLDARKNIVTIASDMNKSIGQYAFLRCSSLQSANFPNVTSVGDYAFNSCSSLQSANFPNVTSVGDYAFSVCSSLQSANFPNVTSLGRHAFSGCSSLLNVNFPNVTSLGEYAFSACSSLLNVNFPNVTSLANYAFYNVPLQSANFPNVTSGTSYAFSGCSYLIDLTFGQRLSNSLNINQWNPTAALSTTLKTLVPADVLQEHPDWMNKDYLLYNIRRHIADLLPDRTGMASLTLTFSANIKSAINGSAETLQKFMDKNWTIA